ncbi:MAG: DNA methyltransferase [Anaerolineae bacterium]|nr:DNA methyltransferase [Anaerolineae bacterium]
MSDNKLFYGDNLDILRNHIQSETVDLIYLDPPFNSNRNYNVLFRDESGTESEAQITAFDDTWHWGETAEATFHDLVTDAAPNVSAAINAMLTLIGRNQMMAYLVMMTARLVELHRVLKPTGSLYLHCDPTASHYLKIMLDAIFGVECFRTEIIWKRSSAHNDAKQGAKQPGRIHDTILFYTKNRNEWTWNPVYVSYKEDYIASAYSKTENGTNRRYKTSDLTAAKGGGTPSYEWKETLSFQRTFLGLFQS